MRRAIRSFACVVGLLAMLCTPAVAAAANGQLAAVADSRLVTLNPDGSGLRTLAVAGPDKITELAWSPGGNRLAFVRAGEIALIELSSGRFVSLTTGGGDANIGWSSDGSKIGFRRGSLVMTVLAAGGTPPEAHGLTLLDGAAQLGWAPDLKTAAVVVGDLLVQPLFRTPPVVAGAPAWSPDGAAIAYVNGEGLSTIKTADGDMAPVTSGPAAGPRWSPDSTTLLYASGNELRTVAVSGGAPRVVLTAAAITAADWQPCRENTLSCESVTPPRCSTTALTAITQADQPVDLPSASCTDPAGRPLTVVVVRAPEHGTFSGQRYTPAAGFTGQDTLTYRLSNGAAESELVRVTLFVLTRPVPTVAVKPLAATPRAPFLSARATPRLDRRRRTLVRISCDQPCSIAVRLTARLRSRRTIKGRQVKRNVPAGSVLRLRLRLPTKPAGRVKTVWITGRVRNAAGDVRAVKLPVRLPR